MNIIEAYGDGTQQQDVDGTQQQDIDDCSADAAAGPLLTLPVYPDLLSASTAAKSMPRPSQVVAPTLPAEIPAHAPTPNQDSVPPTIPGLDEACDHSNWQLAIGPERKPHGTIKIAPIPGPPITCFDHAPVSPKAPSKEQVKAAYKSMTTKPKAMPRQPPPPAPGPLFGIPPTRALDSPEVRSAGLRLAEMEEFVDSFNSDLGNPQRRELVKAASSNLGATRFHDDPIKQLQAEDDVPRCAKTSVDHAPAIVMMPFPLRAASLISSASSSATSTSSPSANVQSNADDKRVRDGMKEVKIPNPFYAAGDAEEHATSWVAMSAQQEIQRSFAKSDEKFAAKEFEDLSLEGAAKEFDALRGAMEAQKPRELDALRGAVAAGKRMEASMEAEGRAVEKRMEARKRDGRNRELEEDALKSWTRFHDRQRDQFIQVYKHRKKQFHKEYPHTVAIEVVKQKISVAMCSKCSQNRKPYSNEK
jgi:hypothetical protein